MIHILKSYCDKNAIQLYAWKKKNPKMIINNRLNDCILQYLQYVFVGLADHGVIVLGVLQQDLVHVRAGILVQLVVGCENNERNLTITEYTQLISLFHQAKFSLGECHL
jgi:hypothetical protein